MKTKRTYIILLALSMMLSFVAGCKKEKISRLDEHGLPIITQTGNSVFACKVNGENWIVDKPRNMYGEIDGNSLRIKGGITLTNSFERFEIEINNLVGNKTSFRLDGSDENIAIFSSNKDCFETIYGYGVGQSISTDGEVVFTQIDRESKVVSGTFWFDIPTDKCGTLNISHGRFYIRYY